MVKEKKRPVAKKENIDKIMQIEGKTRGVTFVTDRDYILRHYDKKTLRAVEDETKKMGYPIDYDKVNATRWYPIGLRIVSLLAIKKTLNWGDEQIEKMGGEEPPHSIIVKLALRFFVSRSMLVEKMSTLWRKHYNIGHLEGEDRGEFVVLRLRDFKLHPILCTFLKGYLWRATKMVGKNVSVKETKCVHRSDEYHEFMLKIEQNEEKGG